VLLPLRPSFLFVLALHSPFSSYPVFPGGDSLLLLLLPLLELLGLIVAADDADEWSVLHRRRVYVVEDLPLGCSDAAKRHVVQRACFYAISALLLARNKGIEG